MATGTPFVCQLIFTPPAVYTTSEGGASYTFNVKMCNSPLPGETFTLTPIYDTAQLLVTPPFRQLTSSNWNTGRNFTVTAVDDAVVEGDLSYPVFVQATSNFARSCADTHTLVTVIDND